MNVKFYDKSTLT